MEIENVTPIQNKVVQALEEIRDENDRLRHALDIESGKLAMASRLLADAKNENAMLRSQVEEIAKIVALQALVDRPPIARTETDDAGT